MTLRKRPSRIRKPSARSLARCLVPTQVEPGSRMAGCSGSPLDIVLLYRRFRPEGKTAGSASVLPSISNGKLASPLTPVRCRTSWLKESKVAARPFKLAARVSIDCHRDSAVFARRFFHRSRKKVQENGGGPRDPRHPEAHYGARPGHNSSVGKLLWWRCRGPDRLPPRSSP
jgi:hypothetical protein